VRVLPTAEAAPATDALRALLRRKNVVRLKRAPSEVEEL
jgi:hypothetical protein